MHLRKVVLSACLLLFTCGLAGAAEEEPGLVSAADLSFEAEYESGCLYRAGEVRV